MAFKIIPLVCLLIVLFPNDVVEGVIGINWGRQSAQRFVPSMVVDLLLQNGISEVRFYSGRKDILYAFAGTDIALTLNIFRPSTINSLDAARDWIENKIQSFPTTKIRRIIVGDQPFSNGILNKTLVSSALDATMLIQNALNELGYGEKTKATISHTDVVMKDKIRRPSEAEFRDEIKEEMKILLRFLEENNAPFVVEFFPLSFVTINNYDPSFAYSDNKSTYTVTDINGFLYTNAFDFLYDAFVWALRKAGAPDVKIVVGQIGWPTDGYPGANVSTAQRFYKSLLPFVTSNKGTPMRPGAPIDINVHALMDENKMPYYYPFARHWGIFRTNGEPKFKIDLTGQGRDIYPTRAVGIMRMPGRWCVFNGESEDTEKVTQLFNYACKKSDCTSLVPGGSCSHLNFARNISYSFNMYFQFHFQAEEACEFEGFGKVVTDDPSSDGCVFPLEVVRGEQDQSGDNSCRVQEVPKCAMFLYLLSTLWALML